MEQHHPADEVQAQEHGQRQRHVHGHSFTQRLAVALVVGELGGPDEVVLAWDRVDGADEQLDEDQHVPLPGHGDPPVVGAVVDHKQLRGRETADVRRCEIVNRQISDRWQTLNGRCSGWR